MENIKVKMSFSHLPDAEVSALAAMVIAKLTGNTNFPFANNELTELVTANDEFVSAKKQAKDGGTLDKLNKKEKRKALDGALRRGAVSVNALGYNNFEKLLSSGYPMAESNEQKKARASREPKTDVVPDMKTITHTNKSGEIFIAVHSTTLPNNGIIIAYTYEEEPPAAPEDWTVSTSTSLTYTIEGLPPRRILKVCLAFIIAGAKKLNWTDVATISTI